MVKKAEQIKKRNPMLPIFGVLTAIALAAIAWVISYYVVIKIPQIKNTMTGAMLLPTGQGTLIFAFGIWLVLLAFTFFLVSILVGKDPDSATEVKLPKRQMDLPKSQRRKKY